MVKKERRRKVAEQQRALVDWVIRSNAPIRHRTTVPAIQAEYPTFVLYGGEPVRYQSVADRDGNPVSPQRREDNQVVFPTLPGLRFVCRVGRRSFLVGVPESWCELEAFLLRAMAQSKLAKTSSHRSGGRVASSQSVFREFDPGMYWLELFSYVSLETDTE